MPAKNIYSKFPQLPHTSSHFLTLHPLPPSPINCSPQSLVLTEEGKKTAQRGSGFAKIAAMRKARSRCRPQKTFQPGLWFFHKVCTRTVCYPPESGLVKIVEGIPDSCREKDAAQV